MDPAIIQDGPAIRQEDTRGHSERTHSHDCKRYASARKQLKQPGDIRRTDCVRGDLYGIGALILCLTGHLAQSRQGGCIFEIVKGSEHDHFRLLGLANDRAQGCKRAHLDVHDESLRQEPGKRIPPGCGGHRIFATLGRMPRGHNPRKLPVRHGLAETIRTPLQKINDAIGQAQRLARGLRRIDNSHHSSRFQGRNYGIAFGLCPRICC